MSIAELQHQEQEAKKEYSIYHRNGVPAGFEAERRQRAVDAITVASTVFARRVRQHLGGRCSVKQIVDWGTNEYTLTVTHDISGHCIEWRCHVQTLIEMGSDRLADLWYMNFKLYHLDTIAEKLKLTKSEEKPTEKPTEEPKDSYHSAKHDNGKPRMDLLLSGCPNTLMNLGAVLEFGARKYAADSWKQVPDAISRYQGALLRHLTQWNQGEKIDPETGLSHLVHAAINAMFIAELEVINNKDK